MQKNKEFGMWGRYAFFCTVWKARNDIVFRDDVLSTQRLKSSFAHFLRSETKVFLVDGQTTLVNFIDYVGN